MSVPLAELPSQNSLPFSPGELEPMPHHTRGVCVRQYLPDLETILGVLAWASLAPVKHQRPTQYLLDFI